MEKEKKLYEIVPGFRRSSQLILLTQENQLFRKKNANRYQCYFKDCKVTVSVNADGACYQLSNIQNHTHPTPTDLIQKLKVINEIKEECAKSGLKRKAIRDIFEEQCFKNEELAASLSFTKMRRTLFNIRNSAMPKSQTSSGELMDAFDEAQDLERKHQSTDRILAVLGKEMIEGESASASGGSFQNTWRLKEDISFVNDSVQHEGTTSNSDNREEDEEPLPIQKGDLFEEVLVRMKNKYDDVHINNPDHEIFFSLMREKFSRLPPDQVDELQGEILLLISKKINKKVIN